MTRRLRFLAALPLAIAADVIEALARLGERTVMRASDVGGGEE